MLIELQGVLTPSLYTMLAYWVPQQERSMSLALVQVGGNIGAVLTMPLSAYLSQHGFSGGWPSVFYVLGVLGTLCFIPWIYQIYNTPAEHPRIRGKELVYIQANVTATNKRKRRAYVPWGSIMTSKQVWISVVTKFCVSWGNCFLMTKLPTYLQSVLHLSMDSVRNDLIKSQIYY
jgi:MFS family permease